MQVANLNLQNLKTRFSGGVFSMMEVQVMKKKVFLVKSTWTKCKKRSCGGRQLPPNHLSLNNRLYHPLQLPQHHLHNQMISDIQAVDTQMY